MDQPTDLSALIAQAYTQAPRPIQTFINSGGYGTFLDELRASGTLSEEAVGYISDEILMMLLGMAEPQELPEHLKNEARLSEEQATAVIALANALVFTPLQEEFEKTAPTERPSPSQAPLVGVPAPIPTAVPIPTPAPVPAAIPVVPPAIAPTAPMPASVNLLDTPPQPPRPAPQTYEPTMRTMAHDVEAMQDGHIPEPVPYTPRSATSQGPDAIPLAVPIRPTPPSLSYTAPSPAPVPTVQREAPPVSTPSATPVPPPAPSPAAMPVLAPSEEVLPPHPVRTFGTPDRAEITSTLQKYGVDPYRESPE